MGVIYESEWTGQDHNKALECFGVAAKTATPNTRTWKKANFFLFNRLLYKDVHLAEKVLVDMKGHLKEDDILLSLAIEQKYVDLYGVQGYLDEAEKCCGNLLSVYHDPQRLPKNDIEKSEIDNILITSSGNMVAYIKNAVDLTSSEKLIRLQRIGTKYPLFTQFGRYLPVIEELKDQLNSETISIASGQIADFEHINNNPIVRSTNFNEMNNSVSEKESDNRTVAVIKNPTGATVPEGKASQPALHRGVFVFIVSVSIIILACLIMKRKKKI